MQYMRAHGNMAGPTQRPGSAGALAGLLAALPAAALLWAAGSVRGLSGGLALPPWGVLALQLAISVLGGTLYGRLFSRAADDRRGGWLFGLCYGYLVWMVGPVALLQWLLHRPVAPGAAGLGILGAHLLFGLVLGLLFPGIHARLQERLRDRPPPAEPPARLRP